MRPHRLELSAFGAFPGRVDLDLDALGRNGLLLLCGDTGGGKTTLLDALGFALYGVVPGERAKAKDELRSHHAAATDPTWVRLEFTACGRRLRITRRPEQLRPAKRGSTLTKEQASAHLEQWSGQAWEPVAQRLDEVGLEVGRLVGMDAAQFFQVVLLPQGRFATFLQADHKDREKLLKQLFHVRRFEHVERWLAERSAEAAAAVETARVELRTVAARLGEQAGVEPPEDVEAEPGWAPALVADTEREARERALEVASRASARKRAEDELAEATDLARRQQERRSAQQALAALEAQAPQLEQLRGELDAAERAVPVAVATAAAAARAEELRQARAAAQESVRAVAALDGPADGAPAALREEAARARVELGRLEGLREVAERVERDQADADAAAGRAGALIETAAAVGARLAELAGKRTELEAAHGQARVAALALPQAEADLEAARREARRAAELADAERAHDALVAAHEEAERQAAALKRAAQELRVQRVDAMAAELAAVLVDDDECPVCGALEHPAPAEVRADHVTREQEQQAEALAGEAGARAAESGRSLAAARERVRLLREQAGPGTDDVDALAERVQGLRERAERLDPSQRRLTALQEEAERLQNELVTAQVEAAQLQERADALSADAGRGRERLRRGLGDGADLPSRLLRTTALAEACDAAAADAEAVAATERAAGVAAATAEALAVAAGFASAAAAQAAARDGSWREESRRRLDLHREQLAGVRARLEEPELDVPLEPAAAVQPAREALAVADAAHGEAVSVHRLVTERLERLRVLLPDWSAAQEALPPLRERAAEVRGLAELTAGRGANRLSMPLSTFVLAARLEEVAAAASLRLSRMTDGRYTLVHSDAGRDRRTRAGLGLQVEDAWTGRLRDTATLSGGETFMTALSLALGLADVVTAEAGGRTIDALFVDEGFGSLDTGSLDKVMDVLDDLRSGGRLVGVVSHVADLRVRIPTQVLVDKGVTGSAVRTTLSAA